MEHQSRTFGDLIQQHLHRKHGLSQNRLAIDLNVSASLISKICRGKRNADRELILSIIKWLYGQDVIYSLTEANQLLKAAEFSELNPEKPEESDLINKIVELQPMNVESATLIRKKTEDFTGRAWVFTEIDEFLTNHSSGYFVLTGEPGIGKSSIIAQLAKNHSYIRFFLERGRGTENVLPSLCRQISNRYKLRYDPTEDDKTQLDRLIEEVSSQLQTRSTEHDRLVILVDALDEADWPQRKTRNVVNLPLVLPERVFFIVTHRKVPLVLVSADETDSKTFELKSNDPRNRTDVENYIRRFANKREVQDKRDMLINRIDKLWESSEGNFMYLRHVLPAICRGEFDLEEGSVLPQGLSGYYETHWKQMQENTGADADWERHYLPVIAYLARQPELQAISWIAEMCNVSTPYVQRVLSHIRPFLDLERVHSDEGPFWGYRIYHASFRDFLEQKHNIQEIEKEKEKEIDLDAAGTAALDRVYNSLE
jgi:serine/threonine-protein kinase